MYSEEKLDEIIAEYAITSNPLKQKIYIALGSIFVVFAIIGIWIPGWPTVSWAVPAAYLFSMSSEKLFRWTLTNRFFGPALFEYYATGKTLPKHVKIIIITMIAIMAGGSAYGVFMLSYPKDPGFGPATIGVVGLIGMWYVATKVKTRD